MTETVEFKISKPNTRWEDTPVFGKLEVENSKRAAEIADNLSTMTGREVRWNWERSPQGHYVGRNVKEEVVD